MRPNHPRINAAPRLAAAAAAVVLALVAAAVPAAWAGGYTGPVKNRKRVCMIQDNIQPKDGLAYTYKGKTYYLCCPMCLGGFSRAPERYSKATDPVGGELVDKATAPIYAYKGRAYFFASRENLEAFARDPERYLKRGRAAGARATGR